MARSTSGPLNALNEAADINKRRNSVPVMQLIKQHRPQTPAALVNLIAQHRAGVCHCGVRSQGTIEDFGRRLFEAQEAHWGHQRFSLEECIDFQHCLFVTNSLFGDRKELEGADLLRDALGEGFQVKRSEGVVDPEMGVDLEVLFHGQLVCGVQVKPTSYSGVSADVKGRNEAANQRYLHQVIYLWYDSGDGHFIDVDRVAAAIRALTDGA